MSEDLRADHPAPGVVVVQPTRGFRYAADAFWLAGFAAEGLVAPARVLDLGTGSGIVALLLASLGHDVVGVDVRPEWEPAWTWALRESRLVGTARLRLGDAREPPPGPFDLAVANPPYFRASEGPVSPDPWKAAARTESTATLADFVAGALRAAPVAVLVLPRERAREATDHAASSGAATVARLDVGERRSLLRLVTGAHPGPTTAFATTDPRVRGWYEVFGARPGPG